MGAIVGAWHNKPPLGIAAGQQTREMLLLQPWLTNIDATELVKRYIKWSYETTHSEYSHPGALMRTYATALQPPMGQVCLSLPMYDWESPINREYGHPAPSVRRTAPDPDALKDDRRPAVFGPKPGPRLRRGRGPQHGMGGGRSARQGAQSAGLCDARLRASQLPRGPPAFDGHPALRHRADVGEKLKGHDVVLVKSAPP